LVLRDGKFEPCEWQEIKVGDLVKVEKNKEIPADLLLVSAPKDVVFVSTINLDGETNLKSKLLAQGISLSSVELVRRETLR